MPTTVAWCLAIPAAASFLAMNFTGVSTYTSLSGVQREMGVEVIADESFQTIDDLPRIGEFFNGVNIKLMKCGGIRNALRIIPEARKRGLKIMLGSMSETSCGTEAALAMAHYASLLDQDGAWLLANDPFQRAAGEQGLGMVLRQA